MEENFKGIKVRLDHYEILHTIGTGLDSLTSKIQMNRFLWTGQIGSP